MVVCPIYPAPTVRYPAFVSLASLSDAHRDEVSRVALEGTAVVIATSTLISVVRTWISPGPDYPGDGAGITEVRTEIPRGQGQRILFLDDEQVLANMGRKMLERLGYVVTTVTDAAAAVEQFSAQPESFDCLVTDLTMPGMLGTEVADRVHRLRPDLPILLVTGYAATLTASAVKALGIRALALKPLNLETLGRSVHQNPHGSRRPDTVASADSSRACACPLRRRHPNVRML